MEGIEILSIGEIGVDYVFNWPLAVIVAIIVAIASGVLSYFIEEDVADSIFLGLTVGFLAGALMGTVCQIPSNTVPTYKITVADTVGLKDFYERYEILEQDGKIFTVKERKEN